MMSREPMQSQDFNGTDNPYGGYAAPPRPYSRSGDLTGLGMVASEPALPSRSPHLSAVVDAPPLPTQLFAGEAVGVNAPVDSVGRRPSRYPTPVAPPRPSQRRSRSARGIKRRLDVVPTRSKAPSASAPSPETVIPLPRSTATVVQSLPRPVPAPAWVRWGQRLQMGTLLLAGGLVVGTMGLYSWTVYAQQQWSDVYERLAQLQRQQQQMVAATEGLKDQITQTGETAKGLVPLSPANAIVVQPADQPKTAPATTPPLPSAEPTSQSLPNLSQVTAPFTPWGAQSTSPYVKPLGY